MNYIARSAFSAVIAFFALAAGTPAIAQNFQTSFTEQDFTLAPGASHPFAIPVAYIPVHITVSFSLENGGTQTPSELMFAVVNWDQKSGQLTWIATSSDGATSAATSLSESVIGNIGGGNVVLSVESLATHTLTLTQSAARTSIPGHYVLTISY
jgi:hypothetical protein